VGLSCKASRELKKSKSPRNIYEDVLKKFVRVQQSCKVENLDWGEFGGGMEKRVEDRVLKSSWGKEGWEAYVTPQGKGSHWNKDPQKR